MLDLDLLADDYAICRLPAGSPLPAGLPADGAIVSVSWTPDEVSVICPAALAPPDAAVEQPWRCLRVGGPVTLAQTGILHSLIEPLAEARVNICAFSTYDTDYLLVPEVRLEEALAALTEAGHRVSGV